jgi:RNA-splicing ligase RtcB
VAFAIVCSKKHGLFSLEEIPDAHKDVTDVVEVVHQVSLGRKVARLRPLLVVEG